MEFVYYFFFWVLVAQVLFYLLLVAPSPRGFKGALTKLVTTSPKFFYFIQALVIVCVIAGLFFYDSVRTQNRYNQQKIQLQAAGHMTSQMRRGWLSCMILKVQRNKYISFMLIYTSAALYLYIRLLNHLYKKRDNYEKEMQKVKLVQERNKSDVNSRTAGGSSISFVVDQSKVKQKKKNV